MRYFIHYLIKKLVRSDTHLASSQHLFVLRRGVVPILLFFYATHLFPFDQTPLLLMASEAFDLSCCVPQSLSTYQVFLGSSNQQL